MPLFTVRAQSLCPHTDSVSKFQVLFHPPPLSVHSPALAHDTLSDLVSFFLLRTGRKTFLKMHQWAQLVCLSHAIHCFCLQPSFRRQTYSSLHTLTFLCCRLVLRSPASPAQALFHSSFIVQNILDLHPTPSCPSVLSLLITPSELLRKEAHTHKKRPKRKRNLGTGKGEYNIRHEKAIDKPRGLEKFFLQNPRTPYTI